MPILSKLIGHNDETLNLSKEIENTQPQTDSMFAKLKYNISLDLGLKLQFVPWRLVILLKPFSRNRALPREP